MFLHIGKNNIIPMKEIIAIIDVESSLISNDTKNFLEMMEKEGNVYKDSNEIKTYIITSKNKFDKKTGQFVDKNIIYTSNISSNTLFKRSCQELNI